jgi:hypothetical protein
MFTQVNGLPVHVLVVHLVVVLVPVAALLAIAQAWSPAVRRWAGILGPLLCLGALVMVPVATSAGEWLQERLPETARIERHADLGGQLWPFVLALFVLSAAGWWLDRREPADRELAGSARGSAPLQLIVAVLVTVVALGTIVQVVRIGDSGAKAVWKGVVSES